MEQEKKSTHIKLVLKGLKAYLLVEQTVKRHKLLPVLTTQICVHLVFEENLLV